MNSNIVSRGKLNTFLYCEVNKAMPSRGTTHKNAWTVITFYDASPYLDT